MSSEGLGEMFESAQTGEQGPSSAQGEILLLKSKYVIILKKNTHSFVCRHYHRTRTWREMLYCNDEERGIFLDYSLNLFKNSWIKAGILINLRRLLALFYESEFCA
jgi:hypothetical protein